jgi:hypothetical protein
MYPMFTMKRILRRGRGQRIRRVYASGQLVEELAALYWRRFRRPLMISETAALGSVRRRRKWLADSVAAVRNVRAEGLPLIGYTWWPLFSLVAWSYRQSTRPAADRYWLRMGLWDVDPGPGLRRIRTAVADDFRALAAAGRAAAGPLAALELPLA